MFKKIWEMLNWWEEKKISEKNSDKKPEEKETKTTVFSFNSKDKKIVKDENPHAKIFVKMKKPEEKKWPKKSAAKNIAKKIENKKTEVKKIEKKVENKNSKTSDWKTNFKKPFAKRPLPPKWFNERYLETKYCEHDDLEKVELAKWTKLRIIPIWWFEEVGKNSMVFEYWNDIMVSDMWLQFAEADMLWVDYVIPDISYLKSKKENIKWIFITHWHLDHIWALKHVLPELWHPNVYWTKLTMALAKKSCEEAPVPVKSKFIEIDPAKDLNLWIFKITPFRVNHSIPDWVWIRVSTPNWAIVHTWDFKFDFTPADWVDADFWKIAQIWKEWVVASFVDSTNSWKEWYSKSEQVVWDSLEKIINDADWRLIMALFSSAIWRISDIVRFANAKNKKIFLSWRSLVNNIEVAKQLWYLKENPALPIERLSEKIDDYDPKDVLLLCTWSQWEDMAALSRMARNEHPIVQLEKEDTVVLSSSPIIWNERWVYTTIDQITTFWCNIITNSAMDIHTSWHWYQQELMLMHSLLKPKYLVPVHWELHMRTKHKKIIHDRLNFPNENMPILYNWSILEIDKNWVAQISKQRLNYEIVMVDWLWVWDVWKLVLDERHMMAANWTLNIVYLSDKKTKKLNRKPEIDTRWFITHKDSKVLLNELNQTAEKLYNDAIQTNPNIELRLLKKIIANWLVRFTDRKIKRVPLISSNIIYI